MSELKQKFDDAMFNIYQRAKAEADYTATIFFRMLSDRGGVETAKFLINSKNQSDGYTALFQKKRLDLTVEALVFENPQYHPLFTEAEIELARERLDKNKYFESR